MTKDPGIFIKMSEYCARHYAKNHSSIITRAIDQCQAINILTKDTGPCMNKGYSHLAWILGF